MWFDPGPFAVRDQFPDDPPISSRAKFAAALDVALPNLDAGDALLGSAHRTIGTVTDAGLDAVYIGTIGHAAAINDEHRNAPNDLTADVLTYNGAGVDSLRDSVLPYLPPPATPITTDFSEPPLPAPGASPADAPDVTS